MSDPRGYLKYPRKEGGRRPVAERIRDWNEFEIPLASSALREQGARCMDCGVPFCQGTTGCPVMNVIPDWNDLVATDRWDEALASLHSTNNFPEFTGKLCPAPCESACVLGINQDPVTIKSIELSIIDRGFLDGKVKPKFSAVKSGSKVAVVGSGPAGLAAAQQLTRLGHEVVVFEKADAVGGLLRYGIPDFKMEKGILDRRLAQLLAEGVTFRTGLALGKDIFLPELSEEYDAVCLAIGAEKPRDLAIPGRDLPGVHFAMDYLVQQNRRLAGKPVIGPVLDARDKHVVILGGGDTGSDCLGAALRQGAREVRQFELLPAPGVNRDLLTPWPLWPMKLRTSHAHEEGGQRDWSVSTTGLIGDDSGVKALRAVRVKKTSSGFEEVPGTEFEVKADLVLLALGFTGPQVQSLSAAKPLARNMRGAIEVGRDFQTGLPGVFAAGDATRGASLIVWAIADGRNMAAAVDRYLQHLPEKYPQPSA